MSESNDSNPNQYEFTTEWFATSGKPTWDQLIPQLNPTTILEIGSYEGASACYLIDNLSKDKSIEIHCVDPWDTSRGSAARTTEKWSSVEKRFDKNMELSISKAKHKPKFIKHKGFSDELLAGLIKDGKMKYFDFIYIDGSHQAPAVLCDAILGFLLLKVGGIMVFDDYLWSEQLPSGYDPVRTPKMAIDAFTTIYCRQVSILPAPLYQLYIQKMAE